MNLVVLAEDARELGCVPWLERIGKALESGESDAGWLRDHYASHKNLHDVVRESALRFARPAA